MGSMCLRHVDGLGRVAIRALLAEVRRDSPVLEEDLNCGRGNAVFEFLADKREGDTVVTLLDHDVVVDVHPRLPDGLALRYLLLLQRPVGAVPAEKG